MLGGATSGPQVTSLTFITAIFLACSSMLAEELMCVGMYKLNYIDIRYTSFFSSTRADIFKFWFILFSAIEYLPTYWWFGFC